MTRTAGIVLAGGRSSRFGGDKLEALLDGAAILDRAIEAVRAVADEIVLAGPGTVARPGVRSVPDAEAFGGPLAALAGALGAVGADRAIVAGGDMPGLVPAVLELLLRQVDRPDVDAAILAPLPSGPRAEGARRQVLPLALAGPMAHDAVAATLAAGDRSLVRLLDRLRVVEVAAGQWLPLDPGARTLLDVDTPADLDRIRGADVR